MKIFYFVSLVAVMVFFSACSWFIPPQVMTPEGIDSKAIAPNNENNLFSTPKNGYARLIMYKERKGVAWGQANTILIKYNPLLDENGKYIKQEADRALCKLNNGSSCIVNIKAGQIVALTHASQEIKNAVLFTPKNQHIYCVNEQWKWGTWTAQSEFNFRDKDTCLTEYQKIYKPKHREYQDKWFNKLVKKGDKRAYKE